MPSANKTNDAQTITSCLKWRPANYAPPSDVHTLHVVPLVPPFLLPKNNHLDTITGYFAESWQLKLAVYILSGCCQLGIAWTGGRKSCT
mgnify:CR=1 FL=1